MANRNLANAVLIARDVLSAIRDGRDFKQSAEQMGKVLWPKWNVDASDTSQAAFLDGLSRHKAGKAKVAITKLRSCVNGLLNPEYQRVALSDDPEFYADGIEEALAVLEPMIVRTAPALKVDMEHLNAVLVRPGRAPKNFKLTDELAARWLKGLADNSPHFMTVNDMATIDPQLTAARPMRLLLKIPAPIRAMISKGRGGRGKGYRLILPSD